MDAHVERAIARCTKAQKEIVQSRRDLDRTLRQAVNRGTLTKKEMRDIESTFEA